MSSAGRACWQAGHDGGCGHSPGACTGLPGAPGDSRRSVPGDPSWTPAPAGKERLFLEAARVLQRKIYVSTAKRKVGDAGAGARRPPVLMGRGQGGAAQAAGFFRPTHGRGPVQPERSATTLPAACLNFSGVALHQA